MPRKKRECKCTVCSEVFESASKEPKYCSTKCRSLGQGKSVWEEVKSNCIECGTEYKTKQDTKGKLQSQFCSKSCQSKYIFKNSGNGMNEDVKKKISDKLTGVSLKERGYSEESISAWVEAGREASVKKCKGNTLEEIVGEKKAKEIKEKHSNDMKGDANHQSLISLSEKFHCSIDDARKLTTCYGLTGNKHPWFGKHHSIESKQMIIDNSSKSLAVIQGYFKNIRWQGSWELEFLINCYEEGVDVKRYDLPPVEYDFEDGIHHTWPDFITHNKYIIEVKGYMNGKSKARIEACKEYFGDDFIVIDSVKKRKEKTSLEWINKQKDEYKDLIEIVNIPKRIKSGWQ